MKHTVKTPTAWIVSADDLETASYRHDWVSATTVSWRSDGALDPDVFLETSRSMSIRRGSSNNFTFSSTRVDTHVESSRV